ncbi:MAG: signal peptidase I [Dehalococcoidia bacterium]
MRETEGPERTPDEADGWDAIVAAAGYEASNDEVPIYRGRADDGRSARRRLTQDVDMGSPWGQRHHGDEAADVHEPPLAEPNPEWALDDDVVLRAFEEHARAEPMVQTRYAAQAAAPLLEDPDEIHSLLGSDANDIVRAAQASPIEGPVYEYDEPGDTEPKPWEDEPPRPSAPVRGYVDEGWDEPDDFPAVPPAGRMDFDGPPAPVVPLVMKSRRRQGRTVVRELVETALLALLVFLAVRASFQNFKVDGNSMSPTLENGEFLIVNKLVYSEVDVDKLSRFLPFLDPGDSPERYVFHGPQRGDIIVLEDPHRPGTDLIKRVIGLPGETIEIINGTIFIDGKLLEEPYIGQPWHYTGPKMTIPDGDYFVMGDNRDNSLDSRSAQVGPVPKDMIIGKALLSYWPSSQFGLAPNESPRLTEKTVEMWQAEQSPTVASPR